MTKAEIEALPAGREMDAAIHQHVFGYQSLPFVDPSYSTDISAAWLVVEKLKRRVPGQHGEWSNIQGLRLEFDGDQWEVSFVWDETLDCGHYVERDSIFAEDAPLAICRAALLAASGE